ncbi:MAG: enoyl-CoA hydratase/isomerase family protein [Planctomycetes bacterium]|nr:enoyl-CoA hydratase/isomerase family protein [Planctomycetota bacterium]
MTDQAAHVLTTGERGVRTITLNRPEVLNACNLALLQALGQALRDAEKDESVRCVVITGAGRAFCSGQDLADVADRYTSPEPIELGSHLRKHYHPVIVRLRTMEKPVVAAVNGVAAGAGCSLALACDVRIAAESASFIEAFVNVGLVPDSASTFMLPRLIGVGRALEMCFTGRKLAAAEALSLGLVTRVVPDADLPAECAKLAQKLSGMPTRAIGLTKRALNAAWTADLESQLEYEAMLQTTAGQSHDHREGVLAFMEKRPPKFLGR